MDAYLQLQHWWADTDAGITTETIPEERIVELERRYNIVLPTDFRQYLLLSSPVSETWDREATEWWGFDRIKNISEDFPHETDSTIITQPSQYLFFADYAIWCWAWAISCSADQSSGRIVLVGGRGYDKIVADNFTDFVEKYIRDKLSVS